MQRKQRNQRANQKESLNEKPNDWIEKMEQIKFTTANLVTKTNSLIIMI